MKADISQYEFHFLKGFVIPDLPTSSEGNKNPSFRYGAISSCHGEMYMCYVDIPVKDIIDCPTFSTNTEKEIVAQCYDALAEYIET